MNVRVTVRGEMFAPIGTITTVSGVFAQAGGFAEARTLPRLARELPLRRRAAPSAARSDQDATHERAPRRARP